ncbi:MAG: hypothetical protein ACJ72J_00590 [Nitrososphaeraceae archaeon]
MAMIALRIPSISIISITIILAASILSVALTEFGNFRIAQGQGNNITSSLTPQQKAAICDPSNPKLNFVNTTESKICGIPQTPTNTTAANATTGTESPSVVPTP